MPSSVIVKIKIKLRVFLLTCIFGNKLIPKAADTAKQNGIITPRYGIKCNISRIGRLPIEFTTGTPIIFIMKKIATQRKNNGVYLWVLSSLFFKERYTPTIEKNNTKIPTYPVNATIRSADKSQ